MLKTAMWWWMMFYCIQGALVRIRNIHAWWEPTVIVAITRTHMFSMRSLNPVILGEISQISWNHLTNDLCLLVNYLALWAPECVYSVSTCLYLRRMMFYCPCSDSNNFCCCYSVLGVWTLFWNFSYDLCVMCHWGKHWWFGLKSSISKTLSISLSDFVICSYSSLFSVSNITSVA